VQESLKSLHAHPGYHFLSDDVGGTDAPETLAKDTTDAHLIILAKKHGLKLATLDITLVSKPWAAGIAENPLIQSRKTS
jgi:predicted nucleic acid-binding protein